MAKPSLQDGIHWLNHKRKEAEDAKNSCDVNSPKFEYFKGKEFGFKYSIEILEEILKNANESL